MPFGLFMRAETLLELRAIFATKKQTEGMARVNVVATQLPYLIQSAVLTSGKVGVFQPLLTWAGGPATFFALFGYFVLPTHKCLISHDI